MDSAYSSGLLKNSLSADFTRGSFSRSSSLSCRLAYCGRECQKFEYLKKEREREREKEKEISRERKREILRERERERDHVDHFLVCGLKLLQTFVERGVRMLHEHTAKRTFSRF